MIRLRLIGLGSTALCLLGCTTPIVQAESRQCQLGRMVLNLSARRGEQLVLDDAPKLHFWNPTFDTAKNVSPALAQAWTTHAPSNLFIACPELKSSLPANARFLTDQERTSRSQYALTFTAPVVDRSGAEALIGQSSTCPGIGLCGSGGTTLFKWVDGKWDSGEVVGFWIS